MSKDGKTYYRSGDWNGICDVCGRKYKASELRKRWDNLIVCPEDWEHRHEMDFLRTTPDRITVPFSRPETTDTFVHFCTAITSQGIVDYGTADCAHADLDNGERPYCTMEGSSGVASYAVAGCFIAENALEGYL